MAHLLGAEALHLEFPTQVVFDAVTLGVDEGDRIGIVGRNGDGKSSLLAMLAGRLEPDGGRVTRRGGVTDRRARPGRHARRRRTRSAEAVVGDIAEHEWAGDARMRDVIAGLLADIPWDAADRRASPAASAAASRSPRCSSATDDVLFLDEPTNHLDVEGIAWLAEHLKRRWARDVRGARRRDPRPVVPRRGLHRRRGRCTTASSSPSRAATRRTSCSASSATGMAAVIRGASGRTSCARSSPGCAAARRRARRSRSSASTPRTSSSPTSRQSATRSRCSRSRSRASARTSSTCSTSSRVRTATRRRAVLHDVEWRIAPGERTGILGVNGAGKSTLLGLVAGRRAAHDRAASSAARRSRSPRSRQRLDELDEHLNDRGAAS